MNVTTLAIAALVVAAMVAGAGYKGYELGEDHVRAEYAARDIQQANENSAFAQKIQEGRRAKEQAWASALSTVSTDYQKRLTDAEGKTTIALNAIRGGGLRLRDPFAKSEACGSSGGQTASTASGRDGAKAGELSGPTSEFLVSLAAEADRNTLQLTACQKALISDRK